MSAYEAAWLMSVNDVARLPVKNHRGTLVGVISRTDLVRHFARSDEEIEREVHEDVIDALPVPEVSVRVEGGCVLLEGEVEHVADLACLRHAVARVPGVVAVAVHVSLGEGADEGAVHARRTADSDALIPRA